MSSDGDTPTPDVSIPADEELVTVQEFARRYRVDASVVRWWVKKGYINYVLVGPRKLRRVRPSDLVRTAHEPDDPVNVWGSTGYFDADIPEAGSATANPDQGDSGAIRQGNEQQSNNGGSSGIPQRDTTIQPDQGQGQRDHSSRPGGTRKGANGRRLDRSKTGRAR